MALCPLREIPTFCSPEVRRALQVGHPVLLVVHRTAARFPPTVGPTMRLWFCNERPEDFRPSGKVAWHFSYCHAETWNSFIQVFWGKTTTSGEKKCCGRLQFWKGFLKRMQPCGKESCGFECGGPTQFLPCQTKSSGFLIFFCFAVSGRFSDLAWSHLKTWLIKV